MPDYVLYNDTLADQPRAFKNVTVNGYSYCSVTNGLTATASGGQSGALLLPSSYNRITTTATAADSVKLPPATPGLQVTVTNSGANSAQVFGSGTDTINGVATATGVALAAGKTATYTAAATGLWFANLSA